MEKSKSYKSKLTIFKSMMLLRTNFSHYMALFHWQPAPYQHYHGFWKNLFKNPKELIFTQKGVKDHDPKPMAILSHQSPWLKLVAHLIFNS